MIATALRLHPACEALPELSSERFAELVESIREHGLEDPIILHDGQVLDGRHRLRACDKAGIEPRFEEWDGRGETPVGFIALKQIRRDMTVSQRAMWAAEYLLPAEEERARERMEAGKKVDPSASSRGGSGKASERVAQAARVGARTVEEAKRIRETAPALVEEVKAGRMTLAEAGRREAISSKVQQLPEDEQERASSFLDEVIADGNHSSVAVGLADNLVSMSEEERLRIWHLNSSEDPRERSLARTEAAKLPPMPHPAIIPIRKAITDLSIARRHLEGAAAEALDTHRRGLEDLADQLRRAE